MEELEVEDETGEEEVAPPAPAVAPEPFEVEVPGIVAALTTLKSPTPAKVPIAAPIVRRFRVRIAESLDRIRVSMWPWLFMNSEFGGRR